MTLQNSLKNQTLTLPKEWLGSDVFIRRYNDTIVIKKMETPKFWETWKKIKPLTKDISKKEIEQAVKWAKQSRQ